MNTGDGNKSLPNFDSTALQNFRFLASFAEIAFDATVVCDAHEHIIHWNPAAEQLFGWSAQEAMGKTPAKLFWPLSTPEEKKDRRQRQSRLKRGETLRGEYQLCHQDSSSLQVQYTARAMFDSKGDFNGYLAIYRGISNETPETTEREQKEALRARTEEVETLLNVSPVAIFVAHDPECTHITGNPAGYRMVALPEDANISKSAPDQERPTYRTFRNGVEVPAEDLPMQKAARLGIEVNEEELELRFEDGSQKFIYAFAKPLFDSQGRSRGAVAAMLDITERKQTEQQLERSHQRLNEILTSIRDDFYVIDRNWIFVYANRQFTSRIGKEPEDFVGKNIWEMFPKHVGTTFEEHLRAAMENREIRRFETPGKYTNVWYRMTVFPSREGITVLGMDITERKQAEEEARASQQMMETVVNHIPAAVALLRGSDLRLQLINPSYQAIAPGKEMLGHTLDELWPETGQDFTAICRRVLETGEPYEVVDELNMIRRQPEGPLEPAYFSWSLYRVRLPGDGGWGLLNTSFETTTRKQVENALRESEQRLRQMIETSPVAIGFGNSTGRIFDANLAFYRLTGYNREEIQTRQMGWDQLTAPEYAELDQQIMATLAATGSAGPYEKEYIRKDGSRVPLLLTVSKLPERDEHIAFIVDMTERKRTEQALAQAMQELQAHINNSPLAIVSFDSKFRITEWSTGAERMFGWRAEEVLNKAIAELHWVHEDDVQRVADLSADMLAGRTSSNMHTNRNYRKDGSVIECEWYNSALLDAQGNIISVRSQVLDITERRRAEEALRENQKQLRMLNETLEQQVQEKTAEVRQLASELIKAVQRERHRLSHILHDDLQQRVYAIRMQLTFLRDHLPQENEIAQKDASDVETQLDEILMVTRNLSIDLSPPILRDEGLSQAINWLAVRMRQRYGLAIELQANGVFALADEELHVLLFNCVRELLFNVVKHAQASQAVVTLQWSDADLWIEVRDDGKGFVVDALVQQSNDGLNAEDDVQSSLGLSTIRHQLSLFDGHMEIQSQPGTGTRVVLIVPITGAG